MARALVIPANVEQDYYYREVKLLQDYQDVVGGFIEGVQLQQLPGTTMFLNEEGKLHNLPANLRATALWHNDIIVGDVLLLNIDDAGESVSISQGNAEIATSVCDAFKTAV